MDMRAEVENYVKELTDVLARVPRADIEKVFEILLAAYRNGKRIFTMGNGGHGSTAQHWVNDLGKHCFVSDAKDSVVVQGDRIRAMCLNNDISSLTAWANDMGYEHAFSEQLAAWVEPGDVVVGISGSGNSANVLRAFEVAKEKGAKTICLSGRDGGKAKDAADVCLIVPCQNMLRIEDIHLILSHLWTDLLREAIQSGSAAGD